MSGLAGGWRQRPNVYYMPGDLLLDSMDDAPLTAPADARRRNRLIAVALVGALVVGVGLGFRWGRAGGGDPKGMVTVFKVVRPAERARAPRRRSPW